MLIASHTDIRATSRKWGQKKNFTLTQREISYSWLNCHTKNKSGFWRAGFFSPAVLKKGKRERGKIRAAEQRCFRVKMLNIKACFGLRGREERRVERQKNLPANRPHQESLQRKKKKTGIEWRKRSWKKGDRKRGSFYFRVRKTSLTVS